jgi:protein-S-isoprenylcysteine O-methyltransferase Ste14
MALFARAAVGFLLLPGMVAFVVPVFVLRPPAAAREFHPIALVPLAIGAVLLLWCVRDFYVSGKGTLAPWSPPRRLVIVFHLRVVFGEEPWLSRTYGDEWQRYRQHVPRWL